MLEHSPLLILTLAASLAVRMSAMGAPQLAMPALPTEVDPALVAAAATPGLAAEEAVLTASNAENGAGFGYGVAISGDTVVVGAGGADPGGAWDAGAAYVFVRSGTAWTEQQVLMASDGDAFDNFGNSVAISGDTVVVGAPWVDVPGNSLVEGEAYVFVRNGTTWTEQAKLAAIVSGSGSSHFGTAVAVSGDTVLIGEAVPFNWPLGWVHAFVRNGTTWSEQQKLLVYDPVFGRSIALSGDTALISGTRSAYVFVRNGATWAQQQKLLSTTAAVYEFFGSSVALSGDTALVGAPSDLSAPSSSSGLAFVFVRNGSTWTEQQELAASDGADDDMFGKYLALSGDTAIIAAPGDDHAGGVDAGSAYVFARNGTGWTEQQKLTASDAAPYDQFGSNTAISSDTIVAGAPGQDQAAMDGGAAYVFRLAPPVTAYCTAGTSASGCQALISATGTPSASALSGFTLQASALEGAVGGLFFWGTGGRQANPWGNGTSFQCVVPPLVRGTTQAGGGTSGACDGSFALDLNALWCPTCPKPHKNPGAGAVVQAQLWYADPFSTSNQTSSLSDAIEFSLQP